MLMIIHPIVYQRVAGVPFENIRTTGTKSKKITAHCPIQNFINECLFSLIPSNLLSFHKASTLRKRYTANLNAQQERSTKTRVCRSAPVLSRKYNHNTTKKNVHQYAASVSLSVRKRIAKNEQIACITPIRRAVFKNIIYKNTNKEIVAKS